MAGGGELLDDGVGAIDESLRKSQAGALSRGHVDGEGELRLLLDGHVAWLRSIPEDLHSHLPGLVAELAVVDAEGGSGAALDRVSLSRDDRHLLGFGDLEQGLDRGDDGVVGGDVVRVDVEGEGGLLDLGGVRDRGPVSYTHL